MRGFWVLGVVVAAAAAGACSQAGQRAEQREAALEERDRPDEVRITGCLTGSPDLGAFVLTAARSSLASGALQAGRGEVPTYTYELMGNAADLAQHVGREVEVLGTVVEKRDAVDVDQTEAARLEPRQSGDEVVTPDIKTRTEAEINVRRLDVSTIPPTGQPCPSVI